ncbi:hypothetical protein ACIQRK_33930 [Streptomyces anulatus]
MAFTTEPKNRAFAWAIHHHPEHGRTVLLVRDADWSSLHHDWMYGRNGFLYRHGGYWWDGTAWHRPSQVADRAFESYDARPVQDALTLTAADLLTRPGTPGNARVAKIADFTAPEGPLPQWHDHLALWAASRRPGSLPLDRCVVDLRAPELDPAEFVGRAGLAQIADIDPQDLPHEEYGRKDLPAAQAETDAGPLWSKPVARDWAEQYHRVNGPGALLSGQSAFGTDQPLGLVADHDRLTKILASSLQDAEDRQDKRRLRRGEAQREDLAAHLAWWPAVALSDGTDGLIPLTALRTTLVEAVIGGLAEDAGRARKSNKARVSLGDIRKDVVRLIDWYILREPARTPALFGEICLTARLNLGLDPRDVGALLRRSLRLDSQLDGDTVDALLDLALPPSATAATD